MLISLTIKNFIVADDIQMNFEKGFSVLLGETGAGKSVIMEAIGVCLGAKASLSKIRNPEKKSYIECVFELDERYINDHEDIQEYMNGETTLIVSASFTSKGTVIRKINGETVTQAMVRKICDGLVSIHSQGSNQTLFNPKGQLEILDCYGGSELSKYIDSYKEAYGLYVSKKKELESFIKESGKEDPDFLKYRISEIEKFNLQKDEIENIEKRLEEISGSEDLADVIEQINDVYEPFSQVNSRLYSIASKLKNTSLNDLAERVRDGLDFVSDTIDDILNTNLEVDPKEIDDLNQRLFDLGELRRKYGKKTSSILDALSSMKQTLEDLEGYDDEKKRREAELEKLLNDAKDKGIELGQQRERIAQQLGKNVSMQMTDLALTKNSFRVSVNHNDEMTMNGMDTISFDVRLNEGFSFAPLKDAASGGEGSRIMLSLKTVLQEAYPSKTLIFDEIDTGISGAIAFKAGEKLYGISKNTQIFCITHLAQVASFYDNAFWIEKDVKDGLTFTKAMQMDDEETIKHIALIMGGSSSNGMMLDSAKELVKEAQRAKAL